MTEYKQLVGLSSDHDSVYQSINRLAKDKVMWVVNILTVLGVLINGGDCCNCRYHIIGKCEWSPEKGFTDRK